MATFKGKVTAVSGLFQQIPSASNVNSQTLASNNSAEMVAVLPFVFGTSTYTITLPAAATVVEFVVAVTTALDGTTPTLKAGSAAAGADLLAAKAIGALGSTAYGCLLPNAQTGTVYVTLALGSSTVGAGKLFVRYIN